MKSINELFEGQQEIPRGAIETATGGLIGQFCCSGECVELRVRGYERSDAFGVPGENEKVVEVLDSKVDEGEVGRTVYRLGQRLAAYTIIVLQERGIDDFGAVANFERVFGLDTTDHQGRPRFDRSEINAFVGSAYMGAFDKKTGVAEYSERELELEAELELQTA